MLGGGELYGVSCHFRLEPGSHCGIWDSGNADGTTAVFLGNQKTKYGGATAAGRGSRRESWRRDPPVLSVHITIGFESHIHRTT